MNQRTIRPARAADLAAVQALLEAARLPTAGVADHFPDGFLVAEDQEGGIVGAAGVEGYSDAGLLRSVVVDPDQRGTGLGQALSRSALEMATSRGVAEVYLLTTTADGFFPRLGFQVVRRDALPAALGASEELRGACPASAVAMRARL